MQERNINSVSNLNSLQVRYLKQKKLTSYDADQYPDAVGTWFNANNTISDKKKFKNKENHIGATLKDSLETHGLHMHTNTLLSKKSYGSL